MEASARAVGATERHVVRETHRLAAADLLDLIEGRTIALRVAGFCSSDDRSLILARVRQANRIAYYGHAPKVGRFGRALVEVGNSPERTREYFDTATSSLEELRSLCAPILTPIDRLRLTLDETWPAGAKLAQLTLGKAFAGLIRSFEAGSEALPHQDLMARSVPDEPLAHALKEELATNIYLQTGRGGRLELWARRPADAEYVALRAEGSYGIHRSDLPPCDASVEPRDGDLILFRATNLHAVSPVEDGARVAWSSFVGFRAPDQPLVLWS
jgi:hypothetical protein